MASIVLITRTLTSQVLETAKGLHSQKNTVKIVTSFDQKPEPNFDFEILCYFKKWSAPEALKLLPKLMVQLPEIFHFFFEQENESASMAHWILLSLAEGTNRATVSSLLGKKIQSKNWRFNPFLKFSKAITVPNRERLMYLKRRNLIDSKGLNEVILPLHSNLTEKKSEDADLKSFLESIQPYIFIPTHARLEFIEMLNDCIEPTDFKVLFLGPRTKNLGKFKRLHSIADEGPQRIELMTKHAKAILLAFHEFEITELMTWQYLSHTLEVPLIARAQQVEILPGLCLHEKNGFTIEKNKTSLLRLLMKNPDLKLASFYKNQTLLPSADHSLNDLSRLYIKALNI